MENSIPLLLLACVVMGPAEGGRRGRREGTGVSISNTTQINLYTFHFGCSIDNLQLCLNFPNPKTGKLNQCRKDEFGFRFEQYSNKGTTNRNIIFQWF